VQLWETLCNFCASLGKFWETLIKRLAVFNSFFHFLAVKQFIFQRWRKRKSLENSRLYDGSG
jgi:hypothetical protein